MWPPGKVYEKLKSATGWGERPLLDQALEVLGCGEPGLHIIKLPTGYGKTGLVYTHAILSLSGECGISTIYASPLRNLADDAYRRWSEVAKGFLGPDLLEGVSGLQHSGEPGSIYLNKPVVFTTLDTLILHAFKLPPSELPIYAKKLALGEEYRGHYEVSRGVLADATVFLDEPHLALHDEAMLKGLLALLQQLLILRSKVVLITATLPSALERIIFKSTRFLERVGLSFSKLSYGEPGILDPVFEEKQKRKRIDTKLTRKPLHNLTNEMLSKARWSRVLAVLNSRSRAVRLYASIASKGSETLLLHGFMLPVERKRILERVLHLSKREKSFVLVATQVVEAGLDASFDVLYTELAPATSLVQRAGRVARWKREEGLVVVSASHSMGPAPYREKELKASLELLKKAEKICWRNVECRGLSYLDLVEKASGTPNISMGEIDYLRNMIVDPIASPQKVLRKVLSGELLRSSNIFPLYVEGFTDYGEIGVDVSFLKHLYSHGLLAGIVQEGCEETSSNAKGEAGKLLKLLDEDPLQGWVEMVRSRIDGFLISEKTYKVEAYGASGIF